MNLRKSLWQMKMRMHGKRTFCCFTRSLWFKKCSNLVNKSAELSLTWAAIKVGLRFKSLSAGCWHSFPSMSLRLSDCLS